MAVKKCVTREIENLTKLSHVKTQIEEESDNKQSKFGHPSVMKLYDAIESSRQIYLVVEKCKGKML